MANKKRKLSPKTVLKLPDLEQSKTAVLNSLTSHSSQRSYDHAIREFIELVLLGTPPRLQQDRGDAGYDVVAAFWSSDSETGSPCSGAIVFTSSFNCWMLRYKLTLFAR